MTAEVRALPLMFKSVCLAIVSTLLISGLIGAQEIQDDPNLAAEQAAPVSGGGVPPADELDMKGDVADLQAQKEKRAEDTGVHVTEFGTVDLAVRDMDLSKVLELLAVQSQRNIIAGRDVSATVTANLYDVTFEQALDSVLRVNGYGYIEEGNFIYVHPIDEIDSIQNAARRIETRIFELYYVSAADAELIVGPLLSTSGQSVALGSVSDNFNPDVGSNGSDSWAFSAKLIVSDYPEVLAEIESIIKDLDIAPTQVLVEGTILSTKVDEENAWGVDWSIIGSIDFTSIAGGPLQTVNDLIGGKLSTNDAAAAVSNVGKTGDAGGFKFGIIKDDFSVFLRALDEVTDTTIVARPKIMCLNRQKAEILVGRRVAYLSTTQTETTTTQTVEYLDTGIHLVFRPFISPDGMIRMELYPRLSEAIERAVADVNGNTVTIPDEVTSEVFTNIRVRDGETLVLGGLFREVTQIKRDQIPLLGDIPIAGAAFTGQDDKITREEIIFMLTPSIVRDERLWEAGRDGLDILDSVRVGTRSGLLPFSQTRMTANYNRDALEAYRNGELDLALFYANNSLRMDAMQPEMRRLRANFSSEADDEFWERSLHDRILHREMEFVPADQLNPAPTEGALDSAPSQTLPPAEGEATSRVPSPQSFDPEAPLRSFAESLSAAHFGTPPAAEPTETTATAVATAEGEHE